MNMLIRVTNGARSRALRLAQFSAICLPVRSAITSPSGVPTPCGIS